MHGTPVLKVLDCWPALPIVVEYGGSSDLNPPSPEDEENILTALKRTDRVSTIHLTVTNSLLRKLYSIESQFSELQDLVLLSQGGKQRTLPRTFRAGPRLRRLHSNGVAFSAPLRLLSSSRDLVDIQLHDISDNRRLSPKTLANALSKMAHLRSLSLRYNVRPTANTNIPALSEERVVKRFVIPSLSCLKYRGMSKDLDNFLERLDAPRLADIEITFCDETQFNVSNLRKFIDRTDMWKLHRQADILFSERSVSISLTQSARTCLKFQVLSDPLRPQIVSIARLCSDIPAFRLGVEDLRIKSTRLSSWLYNVDYEAWTIIIRLFNAAKFVYLAGDISTEVVRALRLLGGRRVTLLPVLSKLCISKSKSRYSSLREEVVSLMTDCRLSGHPVEAICIKEDGTG